MAKILIGYSACQLTREAFEAHGHDVWTCDLLPSRGESPKHLHATSGRHSPLAGTWRSCTLCAPT